MTFPVECPACGEHHELDDDCLTAALMELDSETAREIVSAAGYSGAEDPADLVQTILRIPPRKLPNYTAALWKNPTVAKALNETRPQ